MKHLMVIFNISASFEDSTCINLILSFREIVQAVLYVPCSFGGRGGGVKVIYIHFLEETYKLVKKIDVSFFN